jgi:hypothetical protein
VKPGVHIDTTGLDVGVYLAVTATELFYITPLLSWSKKDYRDSNAMVHQLFAPVDGVNLRD